MPAAIRDQATRSARTLNARGAISPAANRFKAAYKYLAKAPVSWAGKPKRLIVVKPTTPIASIAMAIRIGIGHWSSGASRGWSAVGAAGFNSVRVLRVVADARAAAG